MAILDKRDLRALFIALAIIYFLDSIPSGYLIFAGIVVPLIMIILVLFSDKPGSQTYIKTMDIKSAELVLRIGVVLSSIGILLGVALIVGLGFLIGMILIFSPIDTFNLDPWQLSLTAKEAEKQGKPKK